MGQMGLTMSKNEFLIRVFKGGEMTATWGCWKGPEGTNEYWKGLAGKMDQKGPCHDPCQLSPCSATKQKHQQDFQHRRR